MHPQDPLQSRNAENVPVSRRRDELSASGVETDSEVMKLRTSLLTGGLRMG